MPDELLTCDMTRYAHYLRTVVYPQMARFCRPTDAVVEVCGSDGVERTDRGVISREVIPHARYFVVDRRPDRGDVVADMLTVDAPECDVLLSTAILHHTAVEDLGRLLDHLTACTRRAVLFSGPDAARMGLIGDHRWSIDWRLLTRELILRGFGLRLCAGVGLTPPFCEILIAYEREGKYEPDAA